MNKYIIELDDRIKLVTSVGVTENGVVYTTSDYVHNLEELNSDYINEHYGSLQDDAYERGLEDGRKVGIKDGMCEAWEVAKKIALMDTETSENVTGYFGLFRIMENLTPMQAIEKMKAYEEKQKDRIEVGDEVIWKTDNIKLIVTSMYKVGSINWCDGVAQDGKVYSTLIENNQKTGKHYDIQSILEAMKS